MAPVPVPTAPPTTAPVSSTNLDFVGNDGQPQNSFPLKICQGDCDSDADCEVSFVISVALLSLQIMESDVFNFFVENIGFTEMFR
jgi:hypothetical protein